MMNNNSNGNYWWDYEWDWQGKKSAVLVMTDGPSVHVVTKFSIDKWNPDIAVLNAQKYIREISKRSTTESIY